MEISKLLALANVKVIERQAVVHSETQGPGDPLWTHKHMGRVFDVSAFYSPEAERGLRWNDPAVGIDWPAEPQGMSDKDRKWPDLNPKFHGVELMRGLT